MAAVIVFGDATDHGGEVIEASDVTDTHGRRLARMGDAVLCPRKGHGVTHIVEGDMSFHIDGQAVAYHGCRTSCGAKLLSSQAVTRVEPGQGAGAAVPRYPVLTDMLADAFGYDEQLAAVDGASGRALPGLAYFVRTRSGITYSGYTDKAGLVPRIATEAEEDLTVWFGLAALHMEAARHV